MFCALAEEPEYYVDKVPIFIAISPVTKISSTKHFLLLPLLYLFDEIKSLGEIFTIYEIEGPY